MKRFALLIISLAAATALTGCMNGQASPVADDTGPVGTAVPVEVRYPERMAVDARYGVTAAIEAEGDAPAVARVSGRVVELLVEEGDYVEAGQVLARLDGERLRLSMLAAKAELDRAKGEFERYRDLDARGLISKAMYDNLRYELEALEATWKVAELDYQYSRIRAPITGYVTRRDIKPGEHVAAGTPVFRITDTSELVAYLEIPQVELGKFEPGLAATLRLDSLPGQSFPATIVRLSPTIDIDSGTFRAAATIPNGDGLLAPGMFGRFLVTYETHQDALVIPSDALLDEDEATAVYVAVGDHVERRVIETGIESQGYTEVVSGLAADEQVVVMGHSALRDGSKVLATLDSGLSAG
jgi:membrane fusion protein (multidrug efflux system)